MKNLCLFILGITFWLPLSAQDFDILIKGAYLIDAKNKIQDTMDVGIAEEK